MQEDGGSQIYGGLATASPEDIATPGFEAPPPRHAESTASLRSNSSSCALPAVPQFPPPKTDKPRPHVCTTCMRSFARLEHLKRHERSHTKEKPFACSECTRCFARRDLLLRHQQKLHSSTTPSSRPRNPRRESVAGVGTGRVRKNSVASNAAAGMRPRANTFSHVDASTIGMLANTSHIFNRPPMPGHSYHSSLSGLHGQQGFAYKGLSTSNHASPAELHKLETHDLPTDLPGGLRTAPPYTGFTSDFGLGFNQGLENTINPHALHMDGLNDQSSAFQQMFFLPGTQQSLTEDDGTFDWMTQGFENQMTFHASNENAIDDSSPSAMSTNSPAAQHDLPSEWQLGSAASQNLTSGNLWPSGMPNSANMMNSPMSMDFSSTFAEVVGGATGTVSPKSLVTQAWPGFDMNLPTPPEMTHMDPAAVQYQGFQLSHGRASAPSTASTTSGDSSLQQSSVTTTSSDLVNEGMRNVLVAGLVQNNSFSKRKYSQPMISSPLSPDGASRNRGFNVATFPSTQDLQKFVAAYIKHFHPHLPFLHIPTLDFESPEYATPLRPYGFPPQVAPQGNVANAGSCLMLSLAAIGAVYEGQMDESRELFEYARRLISGYLEERRKINLNRTRFGPRTPADSEDTPLWLVQAMLLNVIYGHNCGDKTTAELASNHCAALVSLARGAELARPYGPYAARRASNQNQQFSYDDPNAWRSMINESEEVDWLEWKVMEERKRTLYAVFILSSMLVTAYNHAPALTNSEIRLDLPCDEELWAAESSQSWLALGGARQADSKAVTFAMALTHLLMSSQRQRRCSQPNSQNIAPGSDSDLKPSTFGCLVLVNALHNYIWETRQRHLSRQWTAQETDQMHQHIEPALRAWQVAWASDPNRSRERLNLFGAGPLSTESIPLLDLAYVRLYINLGRSKEAFWQRDFDTMAAELARGPEATQTIEVKPDNSTLASRRMSGPRGSEPETNTAAAIDASESTPTQRERQLRRAASHAADSLLLVAKLGPSYLEATSHELPAQSAMCALDCAQVLAEWVTAVQGRVGGRIGLIGRDEIDLTQAPAALLLDDKDREILDKCEGFLTHAQERLGGEANVEHLSDSGYAPKLLGMTAKVLEKAAIWPVTKLMAHSLETQATHTRQRVLTSIGETR